MRQKTHINPAYGRYSDFIGRLPQTFGNEGSLIYTGRNTVKEFHMPDGGIIVVKRYKNPNPFQKIAYSSFRKSKARRAFEYSFLLRDKGIDTPEGIAYIEIYRSGMLAESYFLSTYTGNKDLKSLLENVEHPDPELIRATAAFIADMHSKGILHGDPNMTNILVRKDGNTYRFEVIDTNRSVFGSPVPEKAIIGNLVRLTHCRDVSKAVVREYCVLTGRDPDVTIRSVMDGLDRYETKLYRKRKLKRFFREQFSSAKGRG